MKALSGAVFCLSLFATWLAMANRPTGLEKHFQDFDGAFVLYNTAEDTSLRYNPDRCAQRFSPCSTFKIANALISLEEGVIEDEKQVIAYNPKQRPRQSWVPDGLARKWYRDQNLSSAIKQSTVWFFQELALAVGPQTMSERLTQISYGNADTSSGADTFWLDGSLQISPDEQIVFLQDFYYGNLGFSGETTRIVRDIMPTEKGEGFDLSYKTGTDLDGLCWLVGYVTTHENVWFFAFNAQLPEGKRNPRHRLEMVKNILQDLDILPRD